MPLVNLLIVNQPHSEPAGLGRVPEALGWTKLSDVIFFEPRFRAHVRSKALSITSNSKHHGTAGFIIVQNSPR